MTDTRECGWLGCGNPLCEPYCAGVPLYPKHPDPMYKFKRPDGPCKAGYKVYDTSTNFAGEPVCTDCRRTMHLDNGEWVHD